VEWDELKQHDVLFLLTIRPPSGSDVAAMTEDGRTPNAAEKYGLVYVRGCEVSVGVGAGSQHALTAQGIVHH
jgi:intron-binding protein aquarius